MAWHDDVLTGMVDFFLGVDGVRQRIGQRLYRIVAEERIAALENPAGAGSRLTTFAEWRLTAGPAAQNLSAESRFQTVYVQFSFMAFMPADAAATFKVFWDALTDNRYAGTWNGKTVKLAAWDRDSYTEDFDESIRMAEASCVLVVRYLN